MFIDCCKNTYVNKISVVTSNRDGSPVGLGRIGWRTGELIHSACLLYWTDFVIKNWQANNSLMSSLTD